MAATTLECIIYGWIALVLIVGTAVSLAFFWRELKPERQPFSDDERSIPPVPWR